MIRAFDLPQESLDYLRQIADWPSCVESVHRPRSSHARDGAGDWAMILRDLKHEHGLTLEVGHSEEELRERLAEQLAALSERNALEELGVPSYRYSDLMSGVEATAQGLGLDVSNIQGLAFVQAWLDHSERSSAGWLLHEVDSQELRSVVSQVVERHPVADTPSWR